MPGDSRLLTPAFLGYLRRDSPVPPPVGAESIWQPAMSVARRVDVAGVLSDLDDRPALLGELAMAWEIFTGALAARHLGLSAVLASQGGRLSCVYGVVGMPGDDPRVLAQSLEALMAAGLPHLDGSAVDPAAVHPAATDAAEPAGSGAEAGGWSGALAVGTPARSGEDQLSASISDRLLLALPGEDWAVRVLALSEHPAALLERRHHLLNDVRRIAAATDATRAASPLGEALTSQLMLLAGEAQESLDVGGWRVQVVLEAAGQAGLSRLAAVWRAAAKRGAPTSQHLQVVPYGRAVELGRTLSLVHVSERAGPGAFVHPFRHQTAMPSTLLARLVQPPSLEAPGYHLKRVVRFSVPQAGAKDAAGRSSARSQLTLGGVVALERPLSVGFPIGMDDLAKHALVAGMTGAGKTNTVMHVLQSLTAAGIPWLVLEPAKTEYRSLAAASGARVVPVDSGKLRLNPLAVPEGTPIHRHIDLLRSVFALSFGMWTPLPQVLERALYDVYERRGWDVARSVNIRAPAGDTTAAAWPTLDDLASTTDEIVRGLGYEARITADIRAALSTRLRSLSTGIKAVLYGSEAGADMGELLAAPTVVELEPLADDDDKAFLMSLLLVGLVEHRRTEGPAAFHHLLVVEEAHRLLARPQAAPSELSADPRSKATESFANLLSEVRAYGQGVLIADQAPNRLITDAVKNTELKIAHRLVSEDDRATMAAAMGMTDVQADHLVSLPTGRAAVFGHGAIESVIVDVPRVDVPAATVPGPTHSWQDAVDEALQRQASAAARDGDVVAASSRVSLTCLAAAAASSDAEPEVWRDFRQLVDPYQRPPFDPDTLLTAVIDGVTRVLAEQRGRQHGWSLSDTDRWRSTFRDLLDAYRSGEDPTPAARAHRRAADALLRRDVDPYPGCSQICGTQPARCRYRWAAGELSTVAILARRWRDLLQEAPDGTAAEAMWELAQSGGWRLIAFPTADEDGPLRAEAIRASLCYAQQQLHPVDRTVPASNRLRLEALLARALPDDWPPPQDEMGAGGADSRAAAGGPDGPGDVS